MVANEMLVDIRAEFRPLSDSAAACSLGEIGTAPTNNVVGVTRRWRPYLGWIVAAAFTRSGTIHIVHPITFTSIVPHFLPLRTELVCASGGAELICAVGLWRNNVGRLLAR